LYFLHLRSFGRPSSQNVSTVPKSFTVSIDWQPLQLCSSLRMATRRGSFVSHCSRSRNLRPLQKLNLIIRQSKVLAGYPLCLRPWNVEAGLELNDRRALLEGFATIV